MKAAANDYQFQLIAETEFEAEWLRNLLDNSDKVILPKGLDNEKAIHGSPGILICELVSIDDITAPDPKPK